MKSANAPFNEFGQSMILRDIEDLYIDVANLGAADTAFASQLSTITNSINSISSSVSGLGTMASQNANAVAITGGTLTGVTINAQPFANGFCVDGASLSITTSYAAMVWATNEIDPSSVYNASNGIFTAAVTGKYQIIANASIQIAISGLPPGGATVTAGIFKNDTSTAGSPAYSINQSITNWTNATLLSTNEQTASLSRIMTLTAGDTIVIGMKYVNNLAIFSVTLVTGSFQMVYLGT